MSGPGNWLETSRRPALVSGTLQVGFGDQTNAVLNSRIGNRDIEQRLGHGDDAGGRVPFARYDHGLGFVFEMRFPAVPFSHFIDKRPQDGCNCRGDLLVFELDTGFQKPFGKLHVGRHRESVHDCGILRWVECGSQGMLQDVPVHNQRAIRIGPSSDCSILWPALPMTCRIAAS